MIRNRRFNFAQRNPPELSFSAAKQQWPKLWEGTEHVGHGEAQDEKEWADSAFLGGGHPTYVGKLGTLLGGYEQDRHWEHEHQTRRSTLPEEDESSDDDSDSQQETSESVQILQDSFLCRVKERFIYGHLEVCALCILVSALWFVDCSSPVGFL
jgi:hypothetical protein